MQRKLALVFSSFFLVSFKVWSAACCGGGFAAPSIISGDDKAQVTNTISTTEVVVDNVDSQGIWRKWDTHQQVKTFKIEASHVFKDRYQAGISIPLLERTYENKKYSGLADISTTLGYEYLPDWNYNPWRPKGIGFITLTWPTGKSKADSEVGGLDSRGNGFWALGVGTLLTKAWVNLDSFISVEVHKSQEKNIENSQLNARIKPGYGGHIGFGMGYNVNDIRVGSSLTWTYEDAIKTIASSMVSNNGSIERYATALASLSYMYSDDWSGTASYSDQSLFGEPVNTSLGQSWSLQIQRKWGR